MKDNTVLIYAVTLIGIALLSYILWNLDYSEQSTEELATTPDFFCGTISIYPNPESAIEKEGNVLFKTNCAACHKTTKNMTGPALLDVIKNYPSDTSFVNYINRVKTNKEKDKYCMSFPQLSYEDAKALRAYINIYSD
ncbi:cytochrome c [uncultured Dokdonia sp.]|uniref:c-type cytochrome n=1 Tax=uncultured Dokdonia sp. TaxID=575653 RepID=UPI0026117050|nr:cytochrome c [uncultured Dokdonia sp.]